MSEGVADCPGDTCNIGGCKNGCYMFGCTRIGCNDTTKGENKSCRLEFGNCDKGLKCMKQDDGCDNDYGRCVKSGKSKYKSDFK